MNLISLVSGLVKPAIQGFLRWKEGEDKMEITRKDYDLRMKQLEADIEIRLAEEMRKPDSDFRKFVMDYEGAAKDQTPFIKNLRSSVRPLITYWALIIITCVMFGWVDSQALQTNLDAIPPQLWQIFLAIFGFWFGGRALMQVAETWKAGDINKQRVKSDGQAAETAVKAKAEIKKAIAEAKVQLSINNNQNPTPAIAAEMQANTSAASASKKTQSKKKKTKTEIDAEWDDEFWAEDDDWL